MTPYNKVEYNGNTLIDLTGTTATAADVASGKVFVEASGTSTTGTLTFSTIYTGSTAPSPDLGVDGDIYLMIVIE